MMLLILTIAVAAVAADPTIKSAVRRSQPREVVFDLANPSASPVVNLPTETDAVGLLSPEASDALRKNALFPTAGYTLESGERVNLDVVATELVVTFSADPGDSINYGTGRSARSLATMRRLDDSGRVVVSLRPDGEDTPIAIDEAIRSFAGRADVVSTFPVYFHLQSATRLWPTDRIIVGVTDPTLDSEILARFPNLAPAGHVYMDESVRIFRIVDTKGADPLDIADRIAAQLGTMGVKYAQADWHQDYELFAAPNDTRFGDCWHLHNTGQAIAGALGVDTPVSGVDVNGPEAWDIATGTGVVVAIIDDGVQTAHPDLNIWVNPTDVAGGGDQDGNGFTDDINGWDFKAGDSNPNPGTGDAHGMACAGVAVGKGNNSLGTTGAAYNGKVLAVKIADLNGFASDSVIANAINYAWTKADVLSNSWGGGAASSAIQGAIRNANQKGRNGMGSPVLVANGNSASGFIKVKLTGLTAGAWTVEWRYTKNASTVAGQDTVWMDDVSLPGVGIQTFDGVTVPALPAGWTTGGAANFTTIVGGSRRRSGTQSLKAPAIGHSANTWVRFTGTLGAGDIEYHVWYSTQASGDVFDIRLTQGATNYGPFIPLSGESNQYNNYSQGQTNESYPSLHPEAISVAAIAADGYRSYYSQYGAATDFCAPSNGHSFNAGIGTADRTSTDGYNTLSGTAGDYCRAGEEDGFGGTSSATPLASGVAGLVISGNTGLSQSQVRDIMRRTAVKQGPVAYAGGAGIWMGGRNDEYGYGMVNAFAALQTCTGGGLIKGTGQMGPDIITTEVMARPSSGPEYIEIYNKSTTATYTLTGFGVFDNETFTDTAEGCLQFPDNTTIGPRQMLIVFTNGAATSGLITTITTNSGGASGPAGGVKLFEATDSGLSFGGNPIPNMTSVGGNLDLTDTGDNVAFGFVGGDEVSYRGDVVDGMSYGSASIDSGNDIAVGPGLVETGAATLPAAGSASLRNNLSRSSASSGNFTTGAGDPGASTLLGGGGSAPAQPASISYPATSSTGSYTVSWASSSGATSYTLQRSANAGSSWSTVYTGANVSYNETVGNGSYRYQVSASNANGTSAYRTGATDCVVTVSGGSNDQFANGTALSGTSSTVAGNNATFTKETGEPNHASNAGGKSGWWRYTPASNGTLLVTTQGSAFDTTLGIYTGSAVNALTTIGGNDDVVSGTTWSSLSVSVTGGTTYHIAVDGYNGASGAITVNHTFTGSVAPPAAPTGLTYPATSSTGSYNVTWTASSGATSYTVQRSNNGGTSYSTVGTPTGTSYAESLSVNGSYRYRVSATNSGGTSAYTTGSTDCVVTLPAANNNNFANATQMAGASGSATANSSTYTKETGEPNHAGNAGGKSAWWYWTAPANGSATITTAGSNYDTTLHIYTGTAVNALTSVVFNDDTGGQTSSVTFTAASGVTYRVAVDGWNGASGNITLNWNQSTTAPPAAPASISYPSTSSTGSFAVTWSSSSGATSYTVERTANNGTTWTQVYNSTGTTYNESIGNGTYRYRARANNAGGSSGWTTGSGSVVVTVSQPAGNNTFASAGTLTGNSGSASGSNTTATKEVGEPNHAGNAGGKSIWWNWTAPSAGSFSVNTTGSPFDTIMGVYTGTAVNGLTVRGSNDDNGSALTSLVTISVTAGTTYRIAVDGYNGASGAVTLGWSFTPSLLAPPADETPDLDWAEAFDTTPDAR